MLKKYPILLPDFKTILLINYRTALINKMASLYIPIDTGY